MRKMTAVLLAALCVILSICGCSSGEPDSAAGTVQSGGQSRETVETGGDPGSRSGTWILRGGPAAGGGIYPGIMAKVLLEKGDNVAVTARKAVAVEPGHSVQTSRAGT